MATTAATAATTRARPTHQYAEQASSYSDNSIITQATKEFYADNRWESLPQRLANLCQVLNNWTPQDDEALPYSFSLDPMESRRIALTARVLATAPSDWKRQFRSLFWHSLHNQQQQQQQDGRWLESLHTLQWLNEGKVLRQVLRNTVRDYIFRHVQETLAGEYDRDDLLESVLQEWNEENVKPYLEQVFPSNDDTNSNIHWHVQICATCFVQARMEEIFPIVAEYPDSHAAVMELAHVLNQHPHLRTSLALGLQKALTKRLLHPGANTSQIIDVYINTIKVLRHIDPSDRLLQVVAEPVRKYLRGRSDTVRCIITSLTDEEGGGELYDELRRQDAKPLEDAHQDEEDEDEEPGMDWLPPPPLCQQRAAFFDTSVMSPSSSNGNNSLDILSILVSIYGSKELFVDEYRIMLADKLLSNLEFTTDKEVHTLELLKLRFGETSMRQCEIMIKDTDDSKRIVTNIHSTLEKKLNRKPTVDAAIVSHIFWPSIQQEVFEHHDKIQQELDAFSEEYGQLKNPRRLVWYHPLGTVQLELEVEQDGEMRTKEFSCSPLLATLVAHFEDQTEWTLSDLSLKVGLAETAIQKKMMFWLNHQVVRWNNVSKSYQLASAHDWSDRAQQNDSHIMLLLEDEDLNAIGGNDEEELGHVYVSYITGMLKRYKELPLHRIHELLKTFCSSAGSDHVYNKTPRQLSALLQRLCREEKLECGPTGMYKLVEK